MPGLLRFVQKVQGDAPQALLAAGIAPRLAQLLAARGIDTREAAQRYLQPKKTDLHDPMRMQDMDRAVACVREALADGEPIVIYGDYDVDGVMATCILLTFLKKQGANVSYYIPDRHGEGYGLNIPAVESIAQRARLLVTVDCGITSCAEVARARELGMRVIVTDHHQPGGALPQCEAVLNPLLGDYPFRRLCGAGVAFKLVQALGGMEALEPLWELAALATVADIVPLLDENRVIVTHGLRAINQTRRPGLRALIEAAGLSEREITSGHIAFQLAPRINAGGRLALAARGVELMTTRNEEKARAIARELEDDNAERKELEQQILLQAEELLHEQVDFLRDRAIVLCGEGWNPGVIGLAASRLVERYRWPVILLSKAEDVCVGSARSIPGVNIHEALSGCSDLFTRFGGHAQAAGLTMEARHLPAFRRRLNEQIARQEKWDTFYPTEEYDLEVQLPELTEELVHGFDQMQPTGFGNPAPVLCLRGVEPTDARRVGRDMAHLKLRLCADGEQRDGIAFRMGERAGDLPERVDVLFSPSINEWQGERRVQCEVRQMEPFAAPQAFVAACRKNEEGFVRAILAQIIYNMHKPCPTPTACEPLTLEQADAYIRGALADSLQGTLLVCQTLGCLRKWTVRLAVMDAKLDYAMGAPRDARRFNTLLAQPDLSALAAAGNVRRVVLLDGAVEPDSLHAFQEAFAGAQIVCVRDDLGYIRREAQRLALSDEELRALYRNVRALPADSALEVIAEASALEPCKALAGLWVFGELGLVQMEEAPWRVRLLPARKCSLADSELLRRLRTLAG